MIEMTLSEYAKHILRKHFEEEAAKQGIKIVETKSKPKLVGEVVQFPGGKNEQNQS
jgi:hypothetical protein